jgi:hypothetical protein
MYIFYYYHSYYQCYIYIYTYIYRRGCTYVCTRCAFWESNMESFIDTFDCQKGDNQTRLVGLVTCRQQKIAY